MQSHFDKKLKNWGDWMRKCSSGGQGYGSSPLANLMGRAQRAEAGCIIPVDDVEASRVDDAVRSLPIELQRVAMAWYVENLSIRQTAKKLSCSTTTVPIRVEQVCKGVQVWWANKRERAVHSSHDVEKTVSGINTLRA